MIHSFSERLEFLIMKEMSCIIKMPKEYNTFFDEKCLTAMLYSTSKINWFAGEEHLSNLSCILEDSSNEKSVKDFRNDLRINDCKGFMKIIIECAMTFVKLLKTDVKENQVSEAPLDYVQPFSKLLRSFVVAVFIFKIPNTSHGVQKIMLQEEKDVLIELAKVFHHFSPEEFCRIFSCNMNIILCERSRNPALQIFLRSLFVDSSKTRLLSVILLNFILVCAKQFGNKNNFPILSCLLNDVLRAILKFPQNADLLIRFLLPFINVCITIIPSAELPGNFLRVIVSVMVVIKAGHFENIFNHSLALHLATILQTMITWYRTSIDQSFQDQVLEVCLSIAMNCNSEIITSNFQSILTPVVYALNRNNSDLVLKALKVLQAICHLNNGFINSHFLSLRMELVHGLHHALKIPSDETKEIIFHLLTQFHDHGQNFQIQQFLMQR
ncbi:hypothetical protein TNIN_107751 [Trichonephila inaurata madagascariensis]|uniref:Uncharacterized protein n=1 Tax=Trichonephila inaurata madagascariensis TaxID=2747483 RepID=A0A8X6Y357_9ARAC|nr:hypothetical protein TNIN_107751 [Trichonephila inaurata madagascariensis]